MGATDNSWVEASRIIFYIYHGQSICHRSASLPFALNQTTFFSVYIDFSAASAKGFSGVTLQSSADGTDQFSPPSPFPFYPYSPRSCRSCPHTTTITQHWTSPSSSFFRLSPPFIHHHLLSPPPPLLFPCIYPQKRAGYIYMVPLCPTSQA